MFALLAFSAATALAAAVGPLAQDDPFAPLTVYAGTWRAEVGPVGAGAAKGQDTVKVIRNDCWRVTSYFACAQTVDGRPGALIVYVKAPLAGAYSTFAVQADGSAAPKGALRIEGDSWYFPWTEVSAGVTKMARVVNRFVDHDTIEFREESSADGVNWVVRKRGVEHRVP